MNEEELTGPKIKRVDKKMENEYRMFADEIYKKLDEIVKYNNLQTLKENKSFKALWFGDKLNLLWDVVQVQHVEDKIMCYGPNDCLINAIFVAREIPEDVDLELFEALDARILVIPITCSYETMIDKLHNGKTLIYSIVGDIEYNRYVQFPKVEKRN